MTLAVAKGRLHLPRFQFPVGKSHLDDATFLVTEEAEYTVSVPRREEPPR